VGDESATHILTWGKERKRIGGENTCPVGVFDTPSVYGYGVLHVAWEAWGEVKGKEGRKEGRKQDRGQGRRVRAERLSQERAEAVESGWWDGKMDSDSPSTPHTAQAPLVSWDFVFLLSLIFFWFVIRLYSWFFASFLQTPFGTRNLMGVFFRWR
jgi:hypothetical protein